MAADERFDLRKRSSDGAEISGTRPFPKSFF